jgi:flavin reductase (DIM6/NTAB) family NADH-FMN oxidoreductase RutF
MQSRTLDPAPSQFEPADPTELRRAWGRFASGITVVLSQDDAGEVHGMTANGFISVSLDPPLVLVSVGTQTRTHGRLMQQERYSVSVLAHHQADYARHYSGKPQSAPLRHDTLDGFPVVSDSLARMVCRIVDRHPAGDHTLFIAQVEAVDHRDGVPLVFSAGRIFSPLDDAH